MSVLVILLLVNTVCGVFLAHRSYRVTWREFAYTSAIVWVLMFATYGIWYAVKVHDFHYVNDEVIALRYIPEYTYSSVCTRPCHCKKGGCSVCSYPCNKTGGDYSQLMRAKGSDWEDISNSERASVKHLCGEPVKELGERPSSLKKGDRYDTVWRPKPGVVIPWTDTVLYTNKVAVSENIIKNRILISDKAEVYPRLKSVIGTNKVVGPLEIDPYFINVINSKLNEANIIVHGVKDGTLSDCESVKAKWINGKLNDLVICIVSTDNQTIESIKVFGWTPNEILKKELESFLLDKKFSVFRDEREKLVEMINTQYEELDMSKYSYLRVRVSGADWLILIFFFLAFSITGWLVCYHNDITEENERW